MLAHRRRASNPPQAGGTPSGASRSDAIISQSPIVCRVTDAAVDVAALAKKSSVSWILVGDEPYPMWHEWVESEVDGVTEGAICVVGSLEAGGIEQPLPALTDGDAVWVMLRGKSDGQLAARVPVEVSVVDPGSALWEPVTTVLKAGRLNAPDLHTMVERWARECRVFRLVPSGPAHNGADLDDSHRRTAPRLS